MDVVLEFFKNGLCFAVLKLLLLKMPTGVSGMPETPVACAFSLQENAQATFKVKLHPHLK